MSRTESILPYHKRNFKKFYLFLNTVPKYCREYIGWAPQIPNCSKIPNFEHQHDATRGKFHTMKLYSVHKTINTVESHRQDIWTSMRHKWISCLDLSPIPRISHWYMQIIQNKKKNLKHCWSQAFWTRDTQTCTNLIHGLCPKKPVEGEKIMEGLWREPAYSRAIKGKDRLIGRTEVSEKSYRRNAWAKKGYYVSGKLRREEERTGSEW